MSGIPAGLVTVAGMEKSELVERFRARGAYQVSFPDEWTSHLAVLDARLCAVDPGYRLDEVKVKYGTLRFYLADAVSHPCCDAALDGVPDDGLEAAEAAHEVSGLCQAKAAEARFAALERLTAAAEFASGDWR